MIANHVSAMIAIDDADADNGGLEVVSGCFDRVLPIDDRGCVDRVGRSHARVGTGDGARRDARCGSTAARRTAAGPTARRARAGRSTPPTTPAREGDRRAEYYAAKAGGVRAAPTPGDRALVSLIGDFEGRPA